MSKRRIGTTTGLAARTCDKATFKAEQVYVYVDDTDAETHPIIIDGWIGYDVTSKLRMTRAQTVDMIGLLANALEELR